MLSAVATVRTQVADFVMCKWYCYHPFLPVQRPN